MGSSPDMGKDELMRPDYVVLEEEIEDNYQPTEEEIIEYAEWLGMELPRDKDLLWIAHGGLTKPLSTDWKPCRTEEDEIYYFNFETGESRWDHPCDEFHRNLLNAECQKLGRTLATQLWMQSSPEESSSQTSVLRDDQNYNDEGTHEEEMDIYKLATPSRTLGEQLSEAGLNSGVAVSNRSGISQKSPDDGGGRRIDSDPQSEGGFQMELVSEMRIDRKDVRTTLAPLKSRPSTEVQTSSPRTVEAQPGSKAEVRILSSSNEEEEEREMVSSRAQMMAKVRKKIDEEEKAVRDQARRAMQERVDMVINVEEMGLLADEREKMSDQVAKEVELHKQAEVARLRKKLGIEVADQMAGERHQMLEKERAKMYVEVAKQVQEERATEILKRKEMQVTEKFQLDEDEAEQLKRSAKENIKLEHSEYDEKRRSEFLDSTDSSVQDPRTLKHTLQPDFCSLLQYSRNHPQFQSQFLTGIERREIVRSAREKVKLEEMLFDEMREEMVIRVRESISVLERSMFEEEHRLAKIKMRDKVNKLYKEIVEKAELELIEEKEIILRSKIEDMQNRLQELVTCDTTLGTGRLTSTRLSNHLPVTATSTQSKVQASGFSSRGRMSTAALGGFDVPVASLCNSVIPSNLWRAEDDEEKNVKVEQLWSNKDPYAGAGNIMEVTVIPDTVPSLQERRDQIQGKSAKVSQRKHSTDFDIPVASDNLHLRLTESSSRSEDRKNVNVENIQKGRITSGIAYERSKILDSSLDSIQGLKSSNSAVEETIKHLFEDFRKKLKQELLDMNGHRRCTSRPYDTCQELCGVSDLPQPLGWTSGMNIKDLIHFWRNELQDKFLTLKDEMKEELKTLLKLKEAIPENLPTKELQAQRIGPGMAELQLEHGGATETHNTEGRVAESDICKDWRCDENQSHHLRYPRNNTNIADKGERLDIHRAKDISDKTKVSNVHQWISQTDVSSEANSTPELRDEEEMEKALNRFKLKHAGHVTYHPSNQKTLQSMQLGVPSNFEKKVQPPSRNSQGEVLHHRLANQPKWQELSQSSSGLEFFAADSQAALKKRSNLRTARMNKWVQKHIKWIMQQVSYGWRRADTICLKCGMAIKQMVRRLDSGRAIVVSLVQKSRRECKMGRCKGAEHVRASVDAEVSSWHDRRLDRSPNIDPRKRHKYMDSWMAIEEIGHTEHGTLRNVGLRQPSGAEKKNPSDFHLALNPQKNDGAMKWLFSDSELEELRNLWNMDADYENPIRAKSQLKTANRYKSVVEAPDKWTPGEPITRAGNSSTSQEIEDRSLVSTRKNIDPESGQGKSSMGRKKMSDIDMQELEDAIATFRQIRESPTSEVSGLGPSDIHDCEHESSCEVLKVRSNQDREGMTNIDMESLLQPSYQASVTERISEIEEVGEKGPDFITIDFKKPRNNGLALQRTQTLSDGYLSELTEDRRVSHSTSQNGVSLTKWRF
ncbi:hypothetical protein MARPO_0010s0020 [Marchantia polymorpha]|uniref:WW domain-containing protein n=2 Tax=Marchantia polymorpha TaxID=3197 RepID=A0A2R6XKE4_MARPO|nr:hypothetical protein MARPO_0010s0020 [Marchantia polymorpha]|eukprot:PTQ46607.1 hypothetical protein MARPO_0010s0020 [Marchantia polymorpha]